VDASTILDMLVIDHSSHGKCRNLDTIENVTKCQGICESSTFFDNGTSYYKLNLLKIIFIIIIIIIRYKYF